MTACQAPSLDAGTGPLLCDQEQGHRGRHACTVLEQDGAHTYQWGPLRRSGGTQPNAERSRKMLTITLAPEMIARLDAIAVRWGSNRSAAIARLVREAEMPRARR